MLALTSGGDYLRVEGRDRGHPGRARPGAVLEASPTKQALLDEARSAELHVQLRRQTSCCWAISARCRQRDSRSFDLRGGSTMAEFKLNTLCEIAELVPQYRQPPVFPAVTRDLNLVVDESVVWADISLTVRKAAAAVCRAA